MDIKKFIESLIELLKKLIKQQPVEVMTMFRFDRETAKPWSHIIIHHSATRDQETYDWKAISRYHVKVRKWAAIGYNFGLEKDGASYVYCIGRGLDQNGAHTKGMNTKAIGICLVGNYDKVEPNKTQYFLLASLCRNLMKTFDIPIENVQRHSIYSPKTCPGSKFRMGILKKHILGEIDV